MACTTFRKLLHVLSTARPLYLISKMIQDFMRKNIIPKKIIEERMLRALQKT